MVLIKELGKRATISATGKVDNRMWGLFECPSCGTHVERKVNKGRVSKSCGVAGCRVFETNNSWNANIPDTDKLKSLPHYSSFNDYYRRLKAHKEYTITWKSFKEFMDDMYDSYAIAKSSHKKITLFITDNAPLSAANCSWVEDSYVKELDFTSDVTVGLKHSLMLEQDTGVSHNIIARTIAKMDQSFGTCEYKIITKPGFMSRPTMAYMLSDYQYTRLRDRLLDSVKRTSSTHVYLIQSCGLTKIGTTHDVDKRFKVLAGSNASPISLKYSADVTNGIEVEVQLHTKYAEFNTHHEWFNLTEEQVQDIVTYLDSVK